MPLTVAVCSVFCLLTCTCSKQCWPIAKHLVVAIKQKKSIQKPITDHNRWYFSSCSEKLINSTKEMGAHKVLFVFTKYDTSLSSTR